MTLTQFVKSVAAVEFFRAETKTQHLVCFLYFQNNVLQFGEVFVYVVNWLANLDVFYLQSKAACMG